MNPFEKIAEDRIKEAQESGAFDHLEGKGQPLDLSDYFRLPPHLRMGFTLLKNANVLPREVDLLREIEALKARCRESQDAAERRKLTREINEKSVQLSLLLEWQH